ncbi:MAG TPA: phage portal protein [Pedobacter sp.]|uniref:phage portal protein n=1 Tax=Pedobacter sp. TaxID=1411316 RepID=UPI002C954DC9|nr:phage portal protein [Pedobacter sp.]HMI01621.1 phage portal protein [Pedobacter sp.]
MKIFGYKIFEKIESENEQTEITDPAVESPSSFLMTNDGMSISSHTYVNSYVFNGEKTEGELGNPINLIPDHRSIRLRAYEANLTSDVIKIITGKFFKWVVGTGLKLQSEPSEKVLTFEKIKQDLPAFRSNVEAYFQLYANSKLSDYQGMCTLHDNASKAFETAFLGGDSLVVLRLDDDMNVNAQIIDGQQVVTPILDGTYIRDAKARGNTIKHGIEIDKRGQHIAFYVLKESFGSIAPEFERIEAYGEGSGCLMAWMVYGDKHRIDHIRGISNITAILEKVKKLDRYTEASVSSAEERAKIAWTIEHSRFSDGENPMLDRIKKTAGGVIQDSNYALGEVAARNIHLTENKRVYNMPIDAKLKAVDSQSELQYEPFFKAVFVQLCASVDIPPEVALQQYSSNYSASRAAINGWGFIINIYRTKHARNFYQNFYNLWLYTHILKNKVTADGFLKAMRDKNHYILNAYCNARFTGATMPHIDPKKEADAVRIMLGDRTKGETPLMSHEQASELLGNGEWSENYSKYLEEDKMIVKPKPEEDANNG